MAGKHNKKKDEELKLRRNVKLLIAALFIVIVTASALIIYFSNQNTYVAKVDGEKITKAEYMILLNQEKQYMLNVFGIKSGEEGNFWQTQIEGEYAIDRAKKSALHLAWEYEIQYIKAKEEGIKLDKSEKEMVVRYIDSSIPDTINTRTEKDKYFSERFGVTYNEFKSIWMDYFLIQKFMEKKKQQIEVTEEQIKQFYDENRDRIDSVTVKHILVKVEEGATDEEKQKAREKAGQILARVDAGEDFNALVKEFSDDEGSKDSGGEYTFSRGDPYVQEFKDWAFENQVGNTGIVETSFGYHIMKLVNRTEFEDVSQEAENTLKNEKYNDILEEWKGDPELRLIKKDKVFNSIQ